MDRDTHQLFSDMCSELRYIVPFAAKWNPSNPVPAGSLKMEEIQWPSNGDITSLASSVKSHFVCVKVAEMKESLVSANFLMKSYLTISEKVTTNFVMDFEVEAAYCKMQMSKESRYCLTDSDINEASIRILYGNPIVTMICTLNGYWYRVEDKMLKLEPADIETTMEQGVTERSTADYICFHVRDGLRLAAVIIETKVQRAASMNSIAQLIGYYVRSPSISMKPAICLLLTETHLHVVLFPFVDPKDPSTCLVNAIWLKPFTYKKNLFASLYLMTLLTHKDFVCSMHLKVKFGVYRNL